MSSQVPNFNGLITDINRLKKGLGLHVATLEKVLSAKHVLAGLEWDQDRSGLNAALDVRSSLVKFITDSGRLSPSHKTVLGSLLNWDNKDQNLTQRQLDLEAEFGVGRRKRVTMETSAIRVLAEDLLSGPKPRS